MTKLKRKIGAILLTLAMVFTMMPAMALTAFAADSDTAFDVAINGTVVGSVSKTWMEDNKQAPQIFPWPASQGAVWKYVLAEGPGYEATLKKGLGVDNLDAFKDATINALKDGQPVGGKSFLKVSEISGAVSCYKLIDQDGGDITTAFGNDNTSIISAKTVNLDGAASVTPIIGTKQEEFASYGDAYTAQQGSGFGVNATNKIRPYIGGDLTKGDNDLFLKKADTQDPTKGKVNAGAFNFVSKFSLANFDTINLEMAEPQGNGGALTFTSKASQQAVITFADEDKTVGELLLKNAAWSSSNGTIAVVDNNGVVTPKGVGECDITAKTVKGTVLGTCHVTVKASAFPAPAKPTSLKVKNVKKRTAKLSWAAAANAEGYEVYRSTKKKKGFKKVATVTGNSYKNKKLKKGRTYYFKVKSFNIVNGNKVYSGFSSVKKVKIKK